MKNRHIYLKENDKSRWRFVTTSEPEKLLKGKLKMSKMKLNWKKLVSVLKIYLISYLLRKRFLLPVVTKMKELWQTTQTENSVSDKKGRNVNIFHIKMLPKYSSLKLSMKYS